MLLLIMPAISYAETEAELSCDIIKSNAEVQASVSGSPQAFTSVGDAASGTKNIAVGVSQSLSGIRSASLLRESAVAKCDAIKDTLLLDEHIRWSLAVIDRDSVVAQLRVIQEAIKIARANTDQLGTQLAAQTITLEQYNVSRQQLTTLQNKKFDLMGQIAEGILQPPQISNLMTLIDDARIKQARADSLAARAQAETGWDLVASTGVNRPINGGTTSPFVTIGIRYSFGYESARESAARIETKTNELLKIQQNGYQQILMRQADTIRSKLDIENANLKNTSEEIDNLEKLKTPLLPLDTTLSRNALITLELQIKILEADKSGMQAKINGYNSLLLKMNF